MMIGTCAVGENETKSGVVVSQPEPTKKITSSCEVDEDQVFFTVSDVSVDHFVGNSEVVSVLPLCNLDSISCEEDTCEGCEDGTGETTTESTVFQTCETHITSRMRVFHLKAASHFSRNCCL